ncbi:unnamed protein product, partial [Mesorhabditis spiculigera]
MFNGQILETNDDWVNDLLDNGSPLSSFSLLNSSDEEWQRHIDAMMSSPDSPEDIYIADSMNDEYIVMGYDGQHQGGQGSPYSAAIGSVFTEHQSPYSQQMMSPYSQQIGEGYGMEWNGWNNGAVGCDAGSPYSSLSTGSSPLNSLAGSPTARRGPGRPNKGGKQLAEQRWRDSDKRTRALNESSSKAVLAALASYQRNTEVAEVSQPPRAPRAGPIAGLTVAQRKAQNRERNRLYQATHRMNQRAKKDAYKRAQQLARKFDYTTMPSNEKTFLQKVSLRQWIEKADRELDSEFPLAIRSLADDQTNANSECRWVFDTASETWVDVAQSYGSRAHLATSGFHHHHDKHVSPNANYVDIQKLQLTGSPAYYAQTETVAVSSETWFEATPPVASAAPPVTPGFHHHHHHANASPKANYGDIQKSQLAASPAYYAQPTVAVSAKTCTNLTDPYASPPQLTTPEFLDHHTIGSTKDTSSNASHLGMQQSQLTTPPANYAQPDTVADSPDSMASTLSNQPNSVEGSPAARKRPGAPWQGGPELSRQRSYTKQKNQRKFAMSRTTVALQGLEEYRGISEIGEILGQLDVVVYDPPRAKPSKKVDGLSDDEKKKQKRLRNTRDVAKNRKKNKAKMGAFKKAQLLAKKLDLKKIQLLVAKLALTKNTELNADKDTAADIEKRAGFIKKTLDSLTTD